MNTNVILSSPDRVLFGMQIRQETKTGFLNLSDLQDAYDSVRFKKGWSKKEITDIIAYNTNIERIYYLLENQGVIKTSLSVFIESIENQGIIKTLKELGVYKTVGARQTKTSWCNPYIWVLLAMEMNPELYGKVVMWLTDKLIINRIEAGNFYKGLTNHLSKWNNPNYAKIAMLINKKVFGKHELGIRQIASADKLKELTDYEKNLSFSIENGFIKNETDLIKFLSK